MPLVLDTNPTNDVELFSALSRAIDKSYPNEGSQRATAFEALVFVGENSSHQGAMTLSIQAHLSKTDPVKKEVYAAALEHGTALVTKAPVRHHPHAEGARVAGRDYI